MMRRQVTVAVVVAALLQGCAIADGTAPVANRENGSEGVGTKGAASLANLASGQDGVAAKTNALPRCQGAPRCLPSFIARLKNAPFPIDKNDDGTGRPFFTETDRENGSRIHVTRYGDRYDETDHYSDPSVLFHVPRGFDRTKPFRLVVYFHSHESALEPDVVGGIGLIEQIDASGANVILIVPQLAYAAVDSHPGKLIRSGGLARMLDESAGVLAQALGRDMAPRLARAPILLMAFSGGDKALAAGLKEPDGAVGRFVNRIEGIVLLDAVFEEARGIDAWLAPRAGRVFLVGLYSKLSAPWTKGLIDRWKARNLRYDQFLPDHIGQGSVVMVRVETEHGAIANDGPPRDPIAEILRLLPPPRHGRDIKTARLADRMPSHAHFAQPNAR